MNRTASDLRGDLLSSADQITWEGTRTLEDQALCHIAAAIYQGTGNETERELAKVEEAISLECAVMFTRRFFAAQRTPGAEPGSTKRWQG